MSRKWIVILLVIVLQAKVEAVPVNWKYLESSSFLPNYARTLPSTLNGLPAVGLLLPPTKQPHMKPAGDDHDEEAHGFHFGSELESRSLNGGFPDLSAIFNQPVSTYDMSNVAQGRLLRTKTPQPLPANPLTPQLNNFPLPPTTTPTGSPVPPPSGDYSNPFFRPMYTRPAPPEVVVKPVTTSKSAVTVICNCPCLNTFTTLPPATESSTAPPNSNFIVKSFTSSRKKTVTTVTPPTRRTTVKDPYEPFSVSAKITTLAATTSPTSSSIDDLVQEAFNATRMGAGENDPDMNDKDANVVSGEIESSTQDPEPDEPVSSTVKPAAVAIFAFQTTTKPAATTTVTAVESIEERSAKKIPDFREVPETPVIPSVVRKSSNRRFNSLLDLSMRRGGRQHADMS